MMEFDYVLAPFFAYIVAGSMKFLINSLKLKKMAFNQMGLGGMPSTHNTVTATITTLIALKEGIASPVFGVALGFAFIVGIDSIGLRSHLQRHAELLANHLNHQKIKLRTRLAHTPFEALAGIVLGIGCGLFLYHIHGVVKV